MDGAAVALVINTAPRLNTADSFAPITSGPLKPRVNCVCLQAEVFTPARLPDQGSSAEIIQIHYRQQADRRPPPHSLPGSPHGCLHAMWPLNTQLENKKHGTGSDAEVRGSPWPCCQPSVPPQPRALATDGPFPPERRKCPVPKRAVPVLGGLSHIDSDHEASTKERDIPGGTGAEGLLWGDRSPQSWWLRSSRCGKVQT